jgi:branched-chain amino acid transport system permease protein
MEYLLHLAIFICFYTLLSQSLNVPAGKTGLVSLSHACLYGIRAYSTALLNLHFGFFGLNLPIAILISGSIAFLISLVALRTVEDYFESRTGVWEQPARQ